MASSCRPSTPRSTSQHFHRQPQKVAYDMSLSYKLVPKVDQSHPLTRARNSLMWWPGLPSGLGNALSHLSMFLKLKGTRLKRSRWQEAAQDLNTMKSVDPSFNNSLISLVIFALGREAYVFSVTAHHMVTDETSLGIFLHDLLQLYTDGPSSLPPAPLHYSGFGDPHCGLLSRTSRQAAGAFTGCIEGFSRAENCIENAMKITNSITKFCILKG